MSDENSDIKKKSKRQSNISNSSNDTNKEKGTTKASSTETKKNKLDLNAKLLFKDLEAKPYQIPDDTLFQKIKNNLDNPDYKEDELIKDLNDLLDKNPYIEKFNDHEFIKTNDFDIFDKLSKTKIYFNLNLLNFINIINAISYFTQKDDDKFPKILHKLGINFSWVKMKDMKETKEVKETEEMEKMKEMEKVEEIEKTEEMEDVVVILLTPKTPTLYNYLSTHGGIGIQNKEYQEMATQFCINSEKSTVDFGYCYEDFSVSYLSDVIGKDSFKIIPNVMYYIRDRLGAELKKLKLVEIPKGYHIYKSPKISKFSGFHETDFLISMLKTVHIPMNFNFRSLKNEDITITNCNITLEKDNIYIFELKVSIYGLLKDLPKVEKVQTTFKEALDNVKINGECPFSKNFISILMCDNSPIDAQEKAQKKGSLIEKKNLIYSGFQLGITYLNHINNNIRNLYGEIDSLKGKNIELNKEIDKVKFENMVQYGKIIKENDKIIELDYKIIELMHNNILRYEEINEQNGKNTKQKEEIFNLKIKNTSLNNKIEEQKKEIKQLQNENAFQNKEIEQHKKEIEDLKLENSSQNKEINKLKHENTSKNKKIEEQDKKIEEQNNKIYEQDKKIEERDKKIEEQDKKIDMLIKENQGLNQKIDNLNNDLAFIKSHININSEENTKINNDKLYKLCLTLIGNVFQDKSVSINSLLKKENISLLNKNTFETVFKSFESLLRNVLTFNEPLLYSMVISLINEKDNVNNASEVRKLLTKKIKNNDACSPYYKALKNLLFGIEDDDTCEIFKTLEKSKINYIRKLVGFIEIFDACQNIKDIEMRLQGAILYIILNLCDNKKWNSLAKQLDDNDDNNRRFMITLISSLNPNNDDYFN